MGPIGKESSFSTATSSLHVVKRDEQLVADLISHLQEKMINPFDIQQHPPELINVSTGHKASKEVQESLLKSVDTGNAMVKT
jgi:hypothetical protein